MPVSENMEAASTPAMFPLMLNITAVPVIVVGSKTVMDRVAMLDEYGAAQIHVFAAAPPPELIAAAGARLTHRWPEAADFARIRPRLVFVADVDDGQAATFRAHAHAIGAFVHVQDRIPLCDFHLPARLRRGHLQITVSTDGVAAGLSRLIREYLQTRVFGPEWADRVEELAAARRSWKAQGLALADLGKAVSDFVAGKGWLKK